MFLIRMKTNLHRFSSSNCYRFKYVKRGTWKRRFTVPQPYFNLNRMNLYIVIISIISQIIKLNYFGNVYKINLFVVLISKMIAKNI